MSSGVSPNFLRFSFTSGKSISSILQAWICGVASLWPDLFVFSLFPIVIYGVFGFEKSSYNSWYHIIYS